MPPICCPDEGTPPLDDEQLAAMAKALGHPARVAILRSFAECRAHSAGEVVAGLPLAQSTVSEHLRILREAGLLSATEDPPRVWYCVRHSALARLAEAVAGLGHARSRHTSETAASA